MAKKQHYVPQFLLRNWSSDKSSISVYLLDSDKRIGMAPINSQAQKNYYYGKDQKIENLIGQIETEASSVITKILNNERNLSDEDKRTILHFTAIQNARTPRQVKMIYDTLTLIGKSILAKIKLKKDEDSASNFTISLNNSALCQLKMYLQSFLLYADLRIAFLKSRTENQFVIGQHPVVITNKFLTERNWKYSKNGLALKGVTIFFPLSPDIALCLYDNKTYTFVGENKLDCQLEDDEIDNINLYQFCNTENSIYYLANNIHFKAFETKTHIYRSNSSVQVFEDAEKNNRQIISTNVTDCPIIPIQRFLAIKEYNMKLPLSYSYLERPIVRQAECILRKDPRFSVIFSEDQKDC